MVAASPETSIEEAYNSTQHTGPIGAARLRRLINGAVSIITATEVLLVAYPSIIILAFLLTASVLCLVRKDTRGVLDGQDVATQYMVDNTGEVFKEGEETQVRPIMSLFFDTLE